ncbi:MAG: hypothetical protein ACREGA_02790 [Candidatus Saccharimonadales bacterium]
MKTKDIATISMQELRKDPLGFLRQINEGKEVKVIYHSREFATVKSSKPAIKPKTPRSAQYYLDLAAEAHASAKGTLDPNKSIKQLYAETMAEKYRKKYGID